MSASSFEIAQQANLAQTGTRAESESIPSAALRRVPLSILKKAMSAPETIVEGFEPIPLSPEKADQTGGRYRYGTVPSAEQAGQRERVGLYFVEPGRLAIGMAKVIGKLRRGYEPAGMIQLHKLEDELRLQGL